jgi:hypothetical protein
LVRLSGQRQRLAQSARGAPYRTGAADRLAQRLGRIVITAAGDSHVRVFERVRRDHLLEGTWIDVAGVPGATALGLANPNSRTNAFALFERSLRRVPLARRLLFMLGEVDCGFLVWYLSIAEGTSVDDQFERSLRSYETYLERLLASGRRRLAVTSVLPPTVQDYASWPGLRNARREVRASIEDRTALTIAYNARLRDWTEAHDCAYLDLESSVIDPTTGIVDRAYLHPDPSNHHLAPGPLAVLVAGKVSALVWPPARATR